MPRSSFIVVLALVAATFPVAAQSPFTVPCQSQAEFVSRVRTLVQQPERAEQALNEFAIIVLEDKPNDWTLIVTRRGTSDRPRTVHDTSCEALAEVAPLVLSAWIDSDPPPLTAAPEPELPAPAVQPERRLGLGLGLRLETATGLVRGIVSPGASLEFFTLYRGIGLRISSGFSYWLLRDQTLLIQRSERFQRPIWEVYAQLAYTPLTLGDFAFGALLGLALGPAQFSGPDANAVLSLRFIGGLSTGWSITKAWALRLQLGVHFATTALATGPALALGLEYAFR